MAKNWYSFTENDNPWTHDFEPDEDELDEDDIGDEIYHRMIDDELTKGEN